MSMRYTHFEVTEKKQSTAMTEGYINQTVQNKIAIKNTIAAAKKVINYYIKYRQLYSSSTFG